MSLRVYPTTVDPLRVEGDVGIDAVQRRLEPFELELLELLPIHALPVGLPVHRSTSLDSGVSLGAPPQIGSLHVLVGQQFLGWSLEDHPPGLQDIPPVGYAQGSPRVLLDEKDRQPELLPEARNVDEDLPNHPGGQPHGGLVEK